MRHKKGKITILFITTIIALASTGTSYALWYDEVHLDIEVYPGYVEWVFTGILYKDEDYGIPDYHCNPGFEPLPNGQQFWIGEKDVGWTYGEIIDPHTAILELHNVYPCYFNMVSLYIQVLGTVPIRIQSVIFKSPYEEVMINTNTPIVNLDLSGDGLPDIEFWWKDNFFGEQYHPGDYIDETSFWLHIMQPMPQGNIIPELPFTITLVCVQYNEYTPP